jgi:hypothetical protein
MNRNLVSVLALSTMLAACAGGGGHNPATISSVAIPPSTAPTPPPTSPTTPTNTDERQKFEPFSYTYNLPTGETTVSYKVGDYRPSSDFPKTEKYKIADYGFFEATIKGLNNGCPKAECGDEYAAPGPWNHRPYQIIETDINKDGHKDFYLFEWNHGSRADAPDDLIHAFINDGKGHFKLSNDVVFDGGKACTSSGAEFPAQFGGASGALPKNKNSLCGYQIGVPRHILVADFNKDGMDDIFGGMVLQLSNNGKLYNKTLTNLPEYFRKDHMDPLFTHDQYAGDATGDGNLDIFIPSKISATPGKWLDGTSIVGCDKCVATGPWNLLVNDGKGNFSLNQNFPIMGVGKDHPLIKEYMSYTTPERGILWGGKQEALWATTAAIGDFNKDGSGDIAVGWYNPRATETWGLGKNSAGAVYYNDGKNDWRNRPIVPLPANWFGANGNGNDMEVMDFDGDGWLDIVLATTKHDPYYAGRVIQFFKNNKDGTFIDVTKTVHPNPSLYENGTGTPLWNGEGQLSLKDFNHDGKLDIVDSTSQTYVLLNEGNGKFKMYDHKNFPRLQNSDGTYFPVEIDGKWQYDFIGYGNNCSGDACTTSYFQVLDPPANTGPSIYDLILEDFTRKPSTYTTMAAMANRAYTDLFYYSRWNTNNARVFSTYNNGVTTVGGTFGGPDAGFTVLNTKSSNVGPTNVFTGDTDAIGFYANRGKLFTMFGYSHSKLNGSVDSEFFGTARSNTTADTFGAELSYKDGLGKFSYSIGSRYNSTVLKGFMEQGSDVNLRVADQHYNSANLVATLAYVDSFNYKSTRFFYGADVEYLRYFYSNGNDVRVSTGGSFTSVKGVNRLNNNGTFVSLNAGAWINSNTSLLFSVTNATKDPSYTVALGYRF